MNKNHLQTLQVAKAEREVEQVYNEEIRLYFPDCEIMHPYKCDGYIEDSSIRLLIEYKLDELFDNRLVRGKVIMQVLFYLHIFRDNGIFPNVVLVGDKNECFVLSASSLGKYLDYDGIDWSIAPSCAYSYYPALLNELGSDESINPFVFDINEDLDFGNVIKKIKDIANGVESYMEVNVHNISRVFDIFRNRVIKDKKISAHDLVGLFIGCVVDRGEYYKHPNRVNKLVSPMGYYDIDGLAYESFFGYFKKEYSCSEIKEFKGIADRLIEDVERRNSGDFWTPTLFVDAAQDMISAELGENWRDEYAVYDMCCGSKNLTRDYKFKELYCSTLYKSELDMGREYNKGSEDFVFDFLNDWFPMGGELIDEGKVPAGLVKALKENRKIVFLLNPPYATAGNIGKSSKKDVAKTVINEIMLKDGIGACSQNLYAQFLYRILMIKRNYNLTNLYIGLFSPSLFLSGGSYKKFREQFLSDFGYMGGFLFCANEFADCASNWGINFTMWKCGETADKENFGMNIIERGKEGELEIKRRKVVYNVGSKITGNEWIRIKGLKGEDAPQMTSAINVKTGGKTMRGKLVKGGLGYYFNNCSNNVDTNVQFNSLFSSCYSMGNGVTIMPENFTKCTSLFSARKLIVGDWVNSKDEYLAPNEMHPNYREFELDSVIYSLFNTSSNQSSLRNIEYKGERYDIKNAFFFMGKAEMLELADKNGNRECYADCCGDKERFVYEFIKSHYDELSEDAKTVLEKAKDLVRKSFQYRGLFNDLHSEYQINNWDCGWYQIKGLCKEFMPNELKEFTELYKEFGNKLRPMVYELGFLKQ